MRSRRHASNLSAQKKVSYRDLLSAKWQDKPLYFAIGANQSGKSTWLEKAGFKAEKFQDVQIWSRTDESVIEIPSTFLTTEINAWDKLMSRILVAWKEPPCGVMLFVDPSDPIDHNNWMTQVARNMRHLQRALAVNIPLHVILTKQDLIPGFVDYLTHPKNPPEWPSVSFPPDAIARGMFWRRLR